MENRYRVKEQVYASQGKRFANYIIDRIIFLTLFVGLGIAVGIVADLTNNHEIVFFMDNINPILDYVITGVFFAIYYIFLEGKYGISIGKLITKTIVVDEYGDKPSIEAIVKRSFSRMIPFDHFSFLGSNARGWHDSLSKTYVVDKKLLEEKKLLFNDLNKIGQE